LPHIYFIIQAIDNAGACVGVLAKDGIVIASEKKAVSKLLAKSKRSEKIYTIDAHVVCAVAGLTSDANVLIEFMRVQAQQYRFQYSEPIPVEQLVQRICDEKQYLTQMGGMRPYGVSFLFAGWDKPVQQPAQPFCFLPTRCFPRARGCWPLYTAPPFWFMPR